MNLNEYEVTTRSIDRQKTWVDVKHHRIYSREIRGNYYNILKKINPISGDYDYFLGVFKQIPNISNFEVKLCNIDGFGRTSISLSLTNWRLLGFDCLDSDTQLSLTIVESDDNGSIYRFDN